VGVDYFSLRQVFGLHGGLQQINIHRNVYRAARNLQNMQRLTQSALPVRRIDGIELAICCYTLCPLLKNMMAFDLDVVDE
jgi:hypothetical protein